MRTSTVLHNSGGPSAPHWPDVPVLSYAGEGAVGATKRVLIGPDDGEPSFAIRYFEVPAGQASRLEHHRHEHGVVILRGKARVRLGERLEEAGKGDVVYIQSNEVHQLESIGDEPLGFLCVVPAWAEKDGSASCALPDQ